MWSFSDNGSDNQVDSIYRVDHRQWDDSCPGQDGMGDKRFHHTTQISVQFKTYELFIFRIFYLFFRLWLMAGKEGLLYGSM